MPKRGQTHAISEEDRLRYKDAFERMKREDPSITLERLGLRVGLTKSDMSKIMAGKAKQSVAKPLLDRVLGASIENTPIVQRLIRILAELDDGRKNRLLERALALLDEQSRHD